MNDKNPENEPLRILLVDDMPMNLDLAVRLLTRRGHQVTAVENGQRAVEAFQKEAFDVILMDLQMPILDGFQATRRIRKHEADQSPTSRIPIIAITASDDMGDRQNCREAGMDGFITKPIDIKTVVQTICDIIANTKKTL